MNSYAQAIALAPLVAAYAMVAVRFVKGPDSLNRLVAFESLALLTICLAAFAGMAYETEWFFDAILILSLIGFLSTAAVANWLARNGGES